MYILKKGVCGMGTRSSVLRIVQKKLFCHLLHSGRTERKCDSGTSPFFVIRGLFDNLNKMTSLSSPKISNVSNPVLLHIISLHKLLFLYFTGKTPSCPISLGIFVTLFLLDKTSSLSSVPPARTSRRYLCSFRPYNPISW